MIALQSEPCEQTSSPRDTRQDSVRFKVGIKHQISTRLTPTAGRRFQTLPARKLFMEIFSTTARTHTHLQTHAVRKEYCFDSQGCHATFSERALSVEPSYLGAV